MMLRVRRLVANQLTLGQKRRVMYIEGKGALIDGVSARIGWVTFSKSGRTLTYRGLTLGRIKGGGVSGNYIDTESGAEYWVSGVKKRGSNTHPAEGGVAVAIDPDAQEEYTNLRSGGGI